MPGIQPPTIHWYKKLILLYVWMLAVAYCLLQVQHALAATPEAFKFTKVDLDLLQQTNQADKELERNGLVFNDPETNTYLEQVGKRLIPETPLENVKWHFRVLRDPERNAFSLANGSVYIHSGLLSMMRNEAQLAAVLGHEIAHVVNRHMYLANRSARKKAVAASVFAAAGGIAGGAGGIAGRTASIVLGRVVSSLIVLTIYGYDRELEKEADIYGLRVMAQNNYPPIQMTAVFEILKTGYEVDLDDKARGLYRDHPRLDERISYVRPMLDALPVTGEPVVRACEYDRQIKTTMRHDVPLEILVGRARTAVAIATRLTEMDSDDAENAFLLGESYRAMGGRTPRPLPDELTESAKKNTRKQLFKMTPQEYEKALLATPAGKAAWAANVTSAERAYQHALTSNPQYVPAVAGLAALYDAEEKPVEAHEQYLKYLELAPAAKDAYRIRKRADELEKKPGVAISGNTNSN
jgi:predicted Zn-dependent protease